MILAGIVVTVAGWGLAVASLGITQSTGARLGLVLVGIAISLLGILGVLNQHYMKHAIWKK
jgi:uncharacterized membrane protein YgaE (UPF0421/DUF939 family)